MRRFLTLFTMLMLCGVLAFAQTRVVSGRVTDKDGNAVPFASIKIKGTKTGISADANGTYTIRVKDGDVLEVTGTSYRQVDVPVGTLTSITTALEKNTAVSDLKEIVVTGAFGTKRAARSTSSNVQNLGSDQVNTIRQSNINNALAGKVAGAQVRSQSAAKLGVETAVRLRGENNLTGGGSGALYVVDGTIVPSANDINPDDIEDYTILQGPAAAALFGPDGANGAIVMNTKKARRGSKNVGIEINSGVQFDKVYIVPQYQNSYAGGAAGDLQQYHWVAGQPEAWKALDGKFYHDYTDDASWGPRIAGQEYIPWYAWYPGHERSYKTAKLTAQPTNIRDFYNVGVTKTNNINFSKAGENYSVRVSYTNLDQKGLVPTEYLKRHSLNLTSSLDLNDHFTVAANVNYVAQNRNAENNDAYSNQSSGSFGQWFHRDLDMNIMKELAGLKTPDGVLATWNMRVNPDGYNPANPNGFYKANYWYNHFSYFKEVSNLDRRDRLYGDVSLTYKMNNDLRVRFTYRKNQLTTNEENIVSSTLQNSALQTGVIASYETGSTFSDRQNYEGLVTYSKKIKNFAVNANVGFDILKTRYRDVTASTKNGLSVPDLYSLANSKDPINYGNTRQQFARRGVFGRADIGYKNFIFLEGSYRRDFTSSEPVEHYISSYSGGASIVFSDLIKNKNIISYGKIRGSIGQIVNTLDIYRLNINYIPAANQWNGNFLMNEPDGLVSPTLQGANQDEKELGLEMRFLKNRFGFNVTYWDRTNKDFPVTVGLPGQTGYSSITTNAGEVAKTGIDVQVFINPIRSKNVDWNITGTWGRLIKNQIVSIAPGINRLVNASGAFSGSSAAYSVSEVGKKWGQMFGGGIKRINGKPQLVTTGANAGLFIREADVSFGSVLPDYTGGVQNTINLFKNFTLNVNIDFSYGGKFFSLADHWGTFSGLTARTAELNDRGIPVRDPVADGGGVHVFGVDGTGKDVDYYVDAQTYFHQFRTNSIAEDNIYDLTYVKLREFSLGYKIPVEKLGIGKYVKNAIFSVVSRNPWLIYRKAKDFDASEIANVYGEDGQFPGTRSIGFNLKLGF